MDHFSVKTPELHLGYTSSQHNNYGLGIIVDHLPVRCISAQAV
jgi:hypothetical protein